MKRSLVLLILLLLYLTPLAAQTSGASGSESGTGAASAVPEPYERSEFPEWAWSLRRGEIVLFGSLPFSLFYTSFVYDMVRFFINDFDATYAPWPFRGPTSVRLTEDDNINVVLIAAGVSLGVVVADFFIERAQRRRAQAVTESAVPPANEPGAIGSALSPEDGSPRPVLPGND